MSEIPEPELTERLYQSIEDMEAKLKRLSENLQAEKVKLETCENDEEIREVATRIASDITEGLSVQVACLQYALYGLSTGRSQSFKCSLPPPYPTHSDTKVDQCSNDPKHKFCRIHNLRACVLDGHTLIHLP
jgi:hypothetical protein